MKKRGLDLYSHVVGIIFAEVYLYQADLFVLLDQNNFGEESEKVISSLINIKVEQYYNKIRYALVGHFRLEQLRSAKSISQKKKYEELLRKAIKEYSSRATTPIYRTHIYILKAGLLIEKGLYKNVLKLLQRAEEDALFCKSYWAQFYLTLYRARYFRAINEMFKAEGEARHALSIASKQCWVNKIEQIVSEFGLEHYGNTPSQTTTVVDHKTVHETALTTHATKGTEGKNIFNRYMSSLLQVSLSTGSIDSQIQAALDELIRVLGAERGFLFSFDEKTNELSVLAARTSEKQDISNLQGYSKTVINKIVNTKAPLILTDSEEGEFLGSESVVAQNLRSIMAAPLIKREKLIGIAYIDSSLVKGLFEKNDLDIFYAIANHISMALETSRAIRIEADKELFEKDLELTATVQSLFMPETKDCLLNNIQIRGFTRSASQCSGDWWWWEKTPSDKLILWVGDVTGHGAPAAMITAIIAATVRNQYKLEKEKPVLEILKEVNSIVYNLVKGKYTMPMTVFEFDSNTVNWFNAAAPPIIILKSDGTCKTSVSRTSPIGSREFDVTMEKIILEPRDRILGFTDGITEMNIESTKRQLRIKGFIKLLTKLKDMDLPNFEKKIIEGLDELRGSQPQDDDITMVVGEYLENK